ncbi:tripartite tricarboxylate transporter TctB family protein [Acuticoccus sp.]|uniref:tripartite tricarboxylate transporter TctB family protein n=1 Tax=Acuticoccus sp. TaxID=1904378 RepID=UPI003B52144F
MRADGPQLRPRRTVTTAVTVAILALGLWFLYGGVARYGLWQNNGPGPGFFPALFGGLMALFALYELVRPGTGGEPVRLVNFAPAAAAAVAVAAIALLGMIGAMVAFALLWLVVVERRRLVTSLAVAVGLGIGIWLVFVLWLNVIFPAGMLGI